MINLVNRYIDRLQFYEFEPILNTYNKKSSNANSDIHNKIQGFHERLILYFNSKNTIKLPLNRYNKNQVKIYFLVNEITQLYFLYEIFYDIAQSYSDTNTDMKFTNVSATKQGSYEGLDSIMIKRYTNNLFDSFYTDIMNYKGHALNDKLTLLTCFEEYLEYFINCNISLNKINTNKKINEVKNQLSKAKTNLTENHGRPNKKPFIEKISVHNFLAVVYNVRNHYVHNGQLANSGLSNNDVLKKQKFKSYILAFLHEYFERFLLTIHFKLIEKLFL